MAAKNRSDFSVCLLVGGRKSQIDPPIVAGPQSRVHFRVFKQGYRSPERLRVTKMEKDTRTVNEKLTENDYDNVIVLQNPDFATALIGVSIDNRAVYDYMKMLECLREDGMTDEEAVEFIEFNTLRALAYAGPAGPIIFHPLE